MSSRSSTQDGLGSPEAGFGLVDVIVALAIAALGIAAFSQAMGGSYRAAQRTRLQAVALSLAQSQIDTIGADGSLEEGLSTGRYDNGLPWRVTVAPLTATASGTSPPGDGASRPRSGTAEPIPYWIVVEALDARGGVLVRLQTARIGRAP